MEQIEQAIARSKATTPPRAPSASERIDARLQATHVSPVQSDGEDVRRLAPRVIDVSCARIEALRIVAHHPADPRSKPFDMLRTQTLQAMDYSNWQFLGITSPTPACGKTLTAINLSLSIARQPDRPVLLLDLDLHKPQVSTVLGLASKAGIVSTLEGSSKLQDAIVEARVGNCVLSVLPAERRVIDPAELISSRAMSRLIQDIKRDYSNHTVIIDVPPMLASDDVLALLPQIDAVLLIAAVGHSTVSEIKECQKHLQSTAVLRIVLNKSSEPTAGYYGVS